MLEYHNKLPSQFEGPINILDAYSYALERQVDTIVPASELTQPLEKLSGEIQARDPQVMHDELGGKTFAYLSATHVQYREYTSDQLTPGMRRIMSSIGMVFETDEDGQLVDARAPDPERLLNAASKNGIPLALEPDALGESGRISKLQYQRVVLTGNHPVGTHKFSYYGHDAVAIDHMPAVIVLRDELFSIFRRGTKYLHGVAHAYDEFSSNLTEAIEARINGDMDEYNLIVYTVCPKIINGVDGDDQAKDRISESIDRALTDGLARFDIE